MFRKYKIHCNYLDYRESFSSSLFHHYMQKRRVLASDKWRAQNNLNARKAKILKPRRVSHIEGLAVFATSLNRPVPNAVSESTQKGHSRGNSSGVFTKLTKLGKLVEKVVGEKSASAAGGGGGGDFIITV